MNDILWVIFAFVGTFIIGVILGSIIMLLKCDKRFNNMVFGNLIKDDNSFCFYLVELGCLKNSRP